MLDLSGKTSGASCRMGPKKKGIHPAINSMVFPLLQKPADTSMGNIENEDDKAYFLRKKGI